MGQQKKKADELILGMGMMYRKGPGAPQTHPGFAFN